MKPWLFLLPALLMQTLPAFGSGLSATLTPMTEITSPGGSVIFSGTLIDTDTDGSFLFLNDIGVSFTPPAASYLSVDPTGQPASSPNTFFFNNVPGDLIGDGIPVDDSYTGPLLQVYVAPDTPPGTYSGDLNILGGYNGPAVDFSALLNPPAEFQVIVGAPEPAPLCLMLAGLGALGILRRCRSKAG